MSSGYYSIKKEQTTGSTISR